MSSWAGARLDCLTHGILSFVLVAADPPGGRREHNDYGPATDALWQSRGYARSGPTRWMGPAAPQRREDDGDGKNHHDRSDGDVHDQRTSSCTSVERPCASVASRS